MPYKNPKSPEIRKKLAAKARRYKLQNPARYFKNLTGRVGCNLSKELYDIQFLKQAGACAVCLTPQIFLSRRLAIDHCHTTGKFRGLLCSNCNTALGLLKDNNTNINNLSSYLQRSK